MRLWVYTVFMQISSPAFATNTPLPKKYSCDGEGINPPLVFSDIPSAAKSLAIIVDDPDAPRGTFTHWIIYNMPVTTTIIAENSVPHDSVQGKTSLGRAGFIGACPPNGTHRYIFTLYALDMLLPTEQVFDKQGITDAMKGHNVASAQLVGLYTR